MSGYPVASHAFRVERLLVHSAEDHMVRCAPAFYPHTIGQLRPDQQFSSSFRIEHVGPLTVGDVTYGADVRMNFDELGTAYHVTVPLTGAVWSRHRGVEVTADPELGVIYQPEGEIVITEWAAQSRDLVVKLDRGFVEHMLGEALRGTGRPAPLFASGADLTAGPGRSWVSLVKALMTQLGDPDSVLHAPMTAMPFVEAVVSGFLVVASPDYRQALAQPAPHRGTAEVRAAIDIIHAEAHTPLTTVMLARRSLVSVRTLQEKFRYHLGVSPMAYLRSVRLARAHAELQAADAAYETVTAVAYRWGFSNGSRFARMYQQTFGELPSETLRAHSRRPD